MLIWDVVSRCEVFTGIFLGQARPPGGEIPKEARDLGSFTLWMLVIFAMLVLGLALLFFTRRFALRQVERHKRAGRQIPDAWTESARRMKVDDEEDG